MRRSYSENVCKYILRQTLLGLQYLHARHIIHRDIKSDNILIDKEGGVKLADFGYSAQLTTERDARSSKVGTVCWMAPELIKGERRYDTKVDIWSYGIFAMELANGDPPYISEPQHRVIMNIVKKSPPPLDARWSPQFQDFVTKCLIKDPKMRWSADQLLEHSFLADASNYKAECGELITQFCNIRDQAKARKQSQKGN
jgi:serine/threonine protein kinase